MTDQRELDRLMAAFFVEGSEELADRVIDAALVEIDHTPQRRRTTMPRRIQTMTMPIRLATAAVIGALAVGGLWYFMQSSQATVGGPPPTAPITSPSSSAPTAWTSAGNLPLDLSSSSTTRLDDGRILVAGGQDATGNSQTAQIYDPSTGTWSSTGVMAQGRALHTATHLPDGRVLVVGGGNNLTATEVYDPSTGTWSPGTPTLVGRGQSSAVRLDDGRVLVLGGNEDDSVGLAEIFDPATATWTATGNMTAWRASSMATLLTDGRVLVDGGFTADNTSAEIYDPSTGTWTATGRMHTGRVDEQAAVRLDDGRVLVVGGAPTSADLFDPTTGTWSSTGPMVDSYQQNTSLLVAAVLPDGTVFLAGGMGRDGGGFATAQRYDPTTDTWTAVGPLAASKYVRSATLMPDGKVLVVGGTEANGGGTSAPVELYDPTVTP